MTVGARSTTLTFTSSMARMTTSTKKAAAMRPSSTTTMSTTCTALTGMHPTASTTKSTEEPATPSRPVFATGRVNLPSQPGTRQIKPPKPRPNTMNPMTRRSTAITVALLASSHDFNSSKGLRIRSVAAA